MSIVILRKKLCYMKKLGLSCPNPEIGSIFGPSLPFSIRISGSDRSPLKLGLEADSRPSQLLHLIAIRKICQL
jgi:hypothetical protein